MKYFNHPWWHWFFTHLVSRGTVTVMSPDRPKYDYEEWHCSKCDKWHREEKWRKYE